MKVNIHNFNLKTIFFIYLQLILFFYTLLVKIEKFDDDDNKDNIEVPAPME